MTSKTLSPLRRVRHRIAQRNRTHSRSRSGQRPWLLNSNNLFSSWQEKISVFLRAQGTRNLPIRSCCFRSRVRWTRKSTTTCTRMGRRAPQFCRSIRRLSRLYPPRWPSIRALTRSSGIPCRTARWRTSLSNLPSSRLSIKTCRHNAHVPRRQL